MKPCKQCGQRKRAAEFYRHAMMADKRLNVCKECHKGNVRRGYSENRPARAQYELERSKRPERKLQQQKYNERRRKRHPDAYKARYTVSNAIRDGRLTKGACAICGTTKRVQAHHEDYSKPLDVAWLCFKHHREGKHGHVTAVVS